MATKTDTCWYCAHPYHADWNPLTTPEPHYCDYGCELLGTATHKAVEEIKAALQRKGTSP